MADTEHERPARPPVHVPPANHGKTVAAWTLIWLVMVGAVATALGVVLDSVPLLAVGIGVIAVGLVAGWVLRLLGFGQAGHQQAGPGGQH